MEMEEKERFDLPHLCKINHLFLLMNLRETVIQTPWTRNRRTFNTLLQILLA